MAPGYRSVLLIGYEGTQILDIAGPAGLFGMAQDGEERSYRLTLAAPGAANLKTTSGLAFADVRDISDITRDEIAAIDTLMIAGGSGARRACDNKELVAFIANAARCARRVSSVCTGSLLLAKAGLLDGKRATTHWAYCEDMRLQYPGVLVEDNAIFVRDGRVWTSAGVTAGMDLTLALIEEDLGYETALEIARNAVMFMIRPGGQSQFSRILDTQRLERGRLGELIQWIKEHPHEGLSVPRLALKAKMSERTFARVFAEETGETPARFVERLRVELARSLLARTLKPMQEVAALCGFENPDRMRRAFQRQLGISPADFRTRFCPSKSLRTSEQTDDENRYRSL